MISPVLKQIAGLPKLSYPELKVLWREVFGVEPPAYRRGFLIRGLAHRLQELTFGGLKPAYQARLDAMIEGKDTDLAEHEGVTVAFVCRLLPLTCLAPVIVEAILDGRQPKGLRLADLLGNGPVV